MRLKYFATATLVLLHIGFQLNAQRIITGVVKDGQTGEALIGANILIVNTNRGDITDIDGNFTLEVQHGEDSLHISYTGYQDQYVNVSAVNHVEIVMQAGQLLNEVVVIGYGTIKREDATGSVQSVSSENFNRGALTGPQELLAGKIAGVSITSSGDPGGGSKIRIRGESSLNASNDPLIVIDGVPLSNDIFQGDGISGNRNPLDIINPNDIESFTVLKDASATAIYGNRAAGGVILITTKKGKSGKKLNIGYNGNISLGTVSNKVDVLDATEYRQAFIDNFGEDHPAYQKLGSVSTDWQNEIYQTAFGHEHNLNLSGGLPSIPYRLSLGHVNKDGVLKTDNYQRNSIGLNITPGFINNTLQINLGVKGIWTKNQFADRGAIGNASSFDPTQPILDESSPYGGFTTWVDANGNPQFIAPTNPLALLEMKDDNSNINRLITSARIDYRLPFLPALRANLNLARDKSDSEGNISVPQNASFAFDAQTGGGVSNSYSQELTNDLLEFYLNYKKELGKNEIDLMGGYSWQKFSLRNEFTNSNFLMTPEETTQGLDQGELFLLSFFGRLNYTYNSRYLFTFSLRRDGTSRFSPDNRWGLFPAAAVAIKLIDNEKNKFNNVKLRLGYGVTGQESIGNRYAYLPQYTQGFGNAQYQFGESFITTQRPEGYDANIQWEESTTLNAGIDFSIIKDRFSGSLDIYQRKTEDLLNRIPVPAGTNLTNFVTTNVGNMENQGVELALFITPIQTEKIKLNLAFNTSYNKNEITKLTAVDDPNYNGIQVGGIAGGVGSNIQIHSVGYAPFAFYVKEQMYDENGNILEGQFVDRNEDGIDNDFYRLKKPAADWTFGLTSNLYAGKFGFSFGLRALTGNYIYNNVQTDMGYLNRMVTSSNVLYNVHASAVDLQVLDQGNLTFSDHFISEASFLRFDHVTASYDLSKYLKSGLDIYFTVQNPFVITGYEGLDPETDNGIDNNLYPRPRTYVFGVNAKF